MTNNRYTRQTVLQEVGESGQQKLLATKVLVVGCGGLGSEVAVHLAAAGIGEIHLIDFDIVDLSNLHRQVFYNEKNIGESKAEMLCNYIAKLNSEVKVFAYQERLCKMNITQYISNVKYIIDCTDELYTKYLVNDACVLNLKTLIYGSLHKFEAHISVFNYKPLSKQRSTNLRDVFPEIPKENIPTCSEVGTLNSIVSIAANMQVNELYKLVLGIGKPLVNQLLVFNSLDNEIFKLKLKVNENLNFESVWKLNIYEQEVCDVDKALEVSLEELKEGNYKIISLVEDTGLDVFLFTSLKEIKAGKLELEIDKYCVVCERGISSLKAVKILEEQFLESEFMSLEGGINNI